MFFLRWNSWSSFETWWHTRRNQILSFRRNGRIHLNRRGRQFSQLLAAEVCASAVVMLDTPRSEIVWESTGYPLHSPVSPSLPLPCVTVCHQVSNELYHTRGFIFFYFPCVILSLHLKRNFMRSFIYPSFLWGHLPATSTQAFLGFPVSASECWDGSPVSKLLLHASHVALPT